MKKQYLRVSMAAFTVAMVCLFVLISANSCNLESANKDELIRMQLKIIAMEKQMQENLIKDVYWWGKRPKDRVLFGSSTTTDTMRYSLPNLIKTSAGFGFDFICRQWEGKHQTFEYFEYNKKMFILCGSCGDILPIYEKFGGKIKELK